MLKQLCCIAILMVGVTHRTNAQLAITNVNTPYLIDFDSPLPGVYPAAYIGSGYDSSPPNGSLDSDAWAVFGLSDGDLNFGSSGISGDYARGLSSGSVSTGGIYSFDVSNGGIPDYSLGIQPTGTDFSPGYHILKLTNSTVDTVSGVQLSYDIYCFNDQGRSSSFNFEWDEDGLGAYTMESTLDYASPDTADLVPAWSKTFRTFNLSLTLPPGDSLFLKWYSEDVGGSGSRDELALDNIEIEFIYLGNQPPDITTIAVSPDTPTSKQNANIYAEISDPDGVDTAWVIWKVQPNGQNMSIGMTPVTGDTFQTISPIPPQSDSTLVYFRIVASDSHSSPMTDTTGTNTYFVMDSISIPLPGELVINEIMFNPDSVPDSDGEYFEVYNYSAKILDLKGLIIKDKGGENHQINSHLIVRPHEFLTFCRDTSFLTNGGFNGDYQYGTAINLTNSADEIYLINQKSDTIDQVEYDIGAGWPSVAGASMVFRGTAGLDNNDPGNWQSSGIREAGFIGAFGDKGSPSTEASGQLVNYLVYENGSWSGIPSRNTYGMNAIVRSGESVMLDSSASLKALVLEPEASMDLGIDTLFVSDTLYMLADSTGYAQLIGNVEGWVEFESFLMSNTNARWFNVGFPVTATLDSISMDGGGFINTLAQTSGGTDTNQVNIWYYDASVINPNNGEGTWRPVDSKASSTESKGYSIYLGSPYFGALPVAISATGRISNGDQTISLENPLGTGQFNFISNPFPSSIDWNEIITDNPQLNHTYYIYDEGEDSIFRGYNASAGSIYGATQYIAPGQAFFVNSGSSYDLEFQQDCRILSATPNQYKTNGGDGFFIKATTSSGNYDYTYLGFKNDAGDYFHTKYDGRKNANAAKGTPNVYSVFQNQNYMYKFINPGFSERMVPLNFGLRKADSVTISMDQTGYLSGCRVDLLDLKTGQLTNLNSQPYSFYHEPINLKERFVLKVQMVETEVEENKKSEFSYHITEGILHVTTPSFYGRKLTISDTKGRVMVQRAMDSPSIRLDLRSYSAGIYFLNVKSDGGIDESAKLLLR